MYSRSLMSLKSFTVRNLNIFMHTHTHTHTNNTLPLIPVPVQFTSPLYDISFLAFLIWRLLNPSM